jgi:putative membrane protein
MAEIAAATDRAPTPPDASMVLSANRTSLSLERTMMSVDRTLMSAVRTALSLISFGFTIAELFERLRSAGTIAVGQHAARNFGLALILLGVGVLAAGIGVHAYYQRGLVQRRDKLSREHLLPAAARFQTSPTFLAAIVLMVIGIVAALSLVLRQLGAVPS